MILHTAWSVVSSSSKNFDKCSLMNIILMPLICRDTCIYTHIRLITRLHIVVNLIYYSFYKKVNSVNFTIINYWFWREILIYKSKKQDVLFKRALEPLEDWETAPWLTVRTVLPSPSFLTFTRVWAFTIHTYTAHFAWTGITFIDICVKKRLWNVSTWIFNYIWIQRPLWSPNHSAKNEGYKAHLTTSTFVKTNMVTKSPFWPQTLLLTIMDTKPIWTASSLCP